MVPPLRIELSLLGLRVRYATVTSRRDGFVIDFLLRAIQDHTGDRDDTIVSLNVSCHSPLEHLKFWYEWRDLNPQSLTGDRF